MFDIRKYKKSALAQLKGCWKISFLIGAIFFVISLIFSSSIKKLANTEFRLLCLLVVLMFIGNALMVFSYVCLKITHKSEKITLNDLFVSLGEYWLKGSLGMIWFALWTFLWSLLFFFPGIIKCISYSQMFFIMTEYPEIGVRKAMNLSKILTNGHKSDIFVMSLSFIGWVILSLVSMGLGGIFLTPYMGVSFANAYNDLKIEALRIGKLMPSDFSE